METEEISKLIRIKGIDYEIIAYINLDIGNYIIYTNGKTFDNGQIALYVNRICLDNNEVVLDSVENEELLKVMEVLRERLNENE